MSADPTMHALLPWYATGTLEPRQADAFREHLATCAACQAEMACITTMLRRHHGSSPDRR